MPARRSLPSLPAGTATRTTDPLSNNTDGFYDSAGPYLDPFQYSEGIEYVIVGGQVVLDRGRHTGARPGRALRNDLQSRLVCSPP